jgi:hypothetical protein
VKEVTWRPFHAEEQQHSLWVSKVEHKLRIIKEDLQTESGGFQILKVPEYRRQPSSAFTPVAWRFGLHNRENLVSAGSEDVKLAVVALFELDEQSIWISFCNDVVPDPERMLACYGLREEDTGLRTDEIKRVLAFDALSLAVYIEMVSSRVFLAPGDKRLWTREQVRMSGGAKRKFFATFDAWIWLVKFDLCKMENQIPFALIKEAIKHIKRRTNPQYEDEGHPNGSAAQDPDPYLEKWMKEAVWYGVNQFINISDDFFGKEKENPRLSESHHILDAAHKAICGVNGMQRKSDFTQTDYIHVPSVRRLKNSGIQIEGVVGPLCTMSYSKDTKCLSLPKMSIFDQTVPFFRNMAQYEEYSGSNKCMFHDYVLLMLDLIETPEDLRILTDCGVIQNPSRIRGFEMWKALDQGLALIDSSEEHNQMKRDIRSRCKLRRHRLWSEFRTLFLSKPWLALSALAVTLVTVATLIQTYAAVIGSDGMKPQFNP